MRRRPIGRRAALLFVVCLPASLSGAFTPPTAGLGASGRPAAAASTAASSSAATTAATATPRCARPHMQGWLEKGGAATGAMSTREREKALLGWLEDNGMYLSAASGWGRAGHGVRVESETTEDFEPSGRGLIARKGINQGEPLMEINTRLVMTRDTAIAVLRAAGAVIPDTIGEYISLALLLIFERAKGEGSFWKSYIEILPTVDEVGSTISWSDDDLNLLEGSAVVDSTNSLRAKLRKEYAALQAGILAENAQLFPADVFTYDAFEWGMVMLFSRGVNLRELKSLALVPYADLLNHSPYSNAYFQVNNVALTRQQEVVLYADRTYDTNDQVLISYGQKSNAELLLLYGFVCDRNLFDEVELSVALQPDDASFDAKQNYLRSVGLDSRMSFPLLIDRMSSELIEYLRLCCLTPADIGGRQLSEFEYNAPISVANEVAALSALIEGCEVALRGYPRTEAEDAALMENSKMFAALPRLARMAVKLVRNEKRILLRSISVCETQIREMSPR